MSKKTLMTTRNQELPLLERQRIVLRLRPKKLFERNERKRREKRRRRIRSARKLKLKNELRTRQSKPKRSARSGSPNRPLVHDPGEFRSILQHLFLDAKIFVSSEAPERKSSSSRPSIENHGRKLSKFFFLELTVTNVFHRASTRPGTDMA